MNEPDSRHTAPEAVSGASRPLSRRRPGSWSASQPIHLLIGYVISLALLLTLTKLPIDRSLLESNILRTFIAPPDRSIEWLPVATRHESAAEFRKRTSAIPLQTSATETQILETVPEQATANLEAESSPRAQLGSRVPSRRVEAVSSSTNLASLTATTRYMHTAISAPTVDDAPRLRIGTMLIDYPLSALKKAIQGLVIVRFIVETDGRAYDIDVVSGLEPECDEAVVSALRDARFIPGRAGGRTVPAVSQIAVHFKIVDGAPWP